jgi:hypothetical protein
VKRLASGHVVLEWPGGTGEDIGWEVKFALVAAGKRSGG